MSGKIKTAFIVLVLTCLIWVFAERAVTQSDTLQVQVQLVNSRPDLLVRYVLENGPEERLSPQPQTVTLKVEGPAARIQTLRDKPLDMVTVPLDVQKLGYEPQNHEPQDYRPSVLKDLLENSQLRLKNVVFTVTAAEPELLRLRVRRLVPQSLPIKVFDSSGAELTAARIDPAAVDAYVIEGQPAQASVTLTAAQQRDASRAPITVSAVKLPFATRELSVSISLPEGGNPYLPAEIKVPRWGILMPPDMVGKYRVVVENDPLLKETITCRGTTQAVAEYRNSRYHLILEIKENDEIETSIDRPLRYYLPEGYGDIEIVNRIQGTIRFHLEAIRTDAGP